MLNYRLCSLSYGYSGNTVRLLAWLPENIAVKDVLINLPDVHDWWIDMVSSVVKNAEQLKDSPHFYPNATQLKWTAKEIEDIEQKAKKYKELLNDSE